MSISEFEAIFAAAPGINLVLATDAPRFTMLAASDERLIATQTTRVGTLGRGLFEVFSDGNPENDEASGVANLRRSLETVLRTREPHRMAVQRYDLQSPNGTWEVRHWAPRNVPVLGTDGAVRFIVHHVEDVTEAVRRAEAHQQLRGEYAESEGARLALEDANTRLSEQQLELELANQQLQEQAVELEQQTEELQATAAHLEERTEEAERERDRVARSEAKYRALFESIDEGFAVIQMLVDVAEQATDYRFVEANPAFVQQTGLAGAVGRTIRELVPGIEADWIERYGRVAATGEPTRFQSESGVMGRWFDVFAFRVGLPEERRVALLFTDVSAQHATDLERERLLAESERARLDAEAARAEAQAANRTKAEFLATMSHELRTPLNAIGGYAELLEMGIRGAVSDEQRVDLGRIQQSQRHLLGLVNEILDLATVDAGGLRVASAAARVGDTVDAALVLVRPQAAGKALALSDACGANAELSYLGDEPRVRQVLVNLLANAIKFTAPGGQIRVGCTLSGAPEGRRIVTPDVPYLAIWVEDTGAGIPADQREHIFEPFTQLDGGTNPYTRQTGGTGLGLAISRRLARLMGGDLAVESRVGFGSVFTLWLPTAERLATPREMPAAAGVGSTGTIRPEVTAPAPELVASLMRIGAALTAEAGPVIRAWVARLRADPLIPTAGRIDIELEDHAATLVTDAGLALRTLAESDGGHRGEAGELLRDSRAILAVLGERHGAQRARLGWPEAAIPREFAILAEVLRETVRGLIDAADVAAAERVHGVLAQILTQAERVSLGGFRLSLVVDKKS